MNDSQRSSDTRDRILNAAEMLFGEEGYEGTSLRVITKKARVNLAAVHYHFGDKESLYLAVITRRIRPVNAARLAALDEAEKASSGIPLRRVIEIFVRPVFELSCDRTRGGPYIVRMVGRSLTEPQPFMAKLFLEEFQPTIARFGAAIRRCVPQLTPEEFMWRFSFMIGAMHHTLSTLHTIGELSRGFCRNGDHEGALRRYLDFVVAGLSATVTPAPAEPAAPANSAAPSPATAPAATA